MTAPSKQTKLETLLDMISPIEDVNEYIKAVIYGPFGAGKSVLAATAGTKILWVDSGERGYVSLRNHPEWKANVTQVITYENLAQLDYLADTFIDGSFPLDIDTVVIDTANDIQKKDLDKVVAAGVAKDSEKNPNSPDWPDYNANTNRIRRTFSKWRDAPVNVVFVLQEREDEHKATGIRTYRPETPDAIGKLFGQMGHLVGRLTAEGEGADRTRYLQVHPTKTVVAKSRIGGLPVKVVNPNLADIFKNWNLNGTL